MANKYTEFTQLNLPEFEKEVLAKWRQNNAFEKSVSLRNGAKPFVFFEGPPSANGMPGIHHVISRTLKDLVCRYKTMQGYQVSRKGGWDTHGLPIELGVEKELGITKEDIGTKLSVDDYNKKCREAVLRFKDKWDDITQKMGYWVDLNKPYITYENNYIESIWWLLSKMYHRGYLYESVSIQPYSPAAGTGLSSHELNQPGTYKDVKDTSATIIFKINKASNERNATIASIFELVEKSIYYTEDSVVGIMAWTTTPWTLPSNLGLTVGPSIEYAMVETINPYTHKVTYVILAQKLIEKYLKAENENAAFEDYKNDGKNIPYKILGTYNGKELENIRYEQLLPFEANTVEKVKEVTPEADPFRIILGDFVTTEDGTGIVHTAPAFGADDFKVGKANKLGILILVDREGKFVPGTGEYSGRFVKNYKDEPNYVDVNVDISVALKLAGQAFKVEKYEHSYPHCWRTDKPILYYPLDAWFIRTTALRDQMVAANKTIHWKPESTGTGRFGNWLENMVDWNLSRSRFWGTPLPIWQTEDGTEEICIGSVAQLRSEIAKATAAGLNNTFPMEGNEFDLHKPYIDSVVLISSKGAPMKRVPDLIDVWFDSGAMPYAQHHFPFENKEIFANNYPADFIAEGVDQTRGWFYTLHAIASLIKEDLEQEVPSLAGKSNAIAYKTVVSNGLVLDKNGNKMSKRLGNVVDPFDTIEKYGADATRWYLVTNASPWDNLKFDINGIQEVQRKFFGTLYNTYQFFALYANVDGFDNKGAQIPHTDRPELDRWILSSLNSLIKTVTAAMDEYEPTVAGRAIENFVDEHLSNWYVRLSRRRFWKSELNNDKISAYQTLYTCLDTLAHLIAPIAPFFCDILFVNLNKVSGKDQADTIHHNLFPKAVEEYIDKALENRMQLAQDTCSLILSIRKKVITANGETGIKVRQPLQKVMIPVFSTDMQEQLQQVEDIIKAEVNVKEIEYLSPDNDILTKKIKPNFAALGKRLGAKMKAVSNALATFTQADIANIEKNGVANLNVDNETITIQLAEVEISTDDVPGWSVASKGTLTTILDITISEQLEHEGNARELINRVQKIRKDQNLKLTDRIIVHITDIPALSPSLKAFNTYICGEILADNIEVIEDFKDGIEVEINDYQLFVNLTVTQK